MQDPSRSIDETVLTMEGGPYQEYFYIEVPATAATLDAPAEYRRFVYVAAEESSAHFPMQFGIEVRLYRHLVVISSFLY